MDRKLIFINLLLTTTVFCWGQEAKNDCKKFKTGKFTYKEESFNSVIIKRTKNRQNEHDLKSGLKIKYKIHWTGDCEYELISLWSNDQEVRKHKGSIIKVKILSTFNDSYEYIADYEGSITQYTVVRLQKQ